MFWLIGTVFALRNFLTLTTLGGSTRIFREIRDLLVFGDLGDLKILRPRSWPKKGRKWSTKGGKWSTKRPKMVHKGPKMVQKGDPTFGAPFPDTPPPRRCRTRRRSNFGVKKVKEPGPFFGSDDRSFEWEKRNLHV